VTSITYLAFLRGRVHVVTILFAIVSCSKTGRSDECATSKPQPHLILISLNIRILTFDHTRQASCIGLHTSRTSLIRLRPSAVSLEEVLPAHAQKGSQLVVRIAILSIVIRRHRRPLWVSPLLPDFSLQSPAFSAARECDELPSFDFYRLFDWLTQDVFYTRF
jgi:hypothetical protein